MSKKMITILSIFVPCASLAFGTSGENWTPITQVQAIQSTAQEMAKIVGKPQLSKEAQQTQITPDVPECPANVTEKLAEKGFTLKHIMNHGTPLDYAARAVSIAAACASQNGSVSVEIVNADPFQVSPNDLFLHSLNQIGIDSYEKQEKFLKTLTYVVLPELQSSTSKWYFSRELSLRYYVDALEREILLK